MTHDPFTLTVIQASLGAAAEEMFAVLAKTAMSPIIYEVLDVGTGVTDGEGNLVSSGAGIPTFVGVLDKAVRRIIEIHRDNIHEGDVFITNDPNFGGVTHLNDVVIAKPVFFEDKCMAWTASIAHWGDIGGKVPGSMATDVTEIFAEGLRLPAVKLFAKGRKLQPVFDIIESNSRLPDFVRGDLWAQVAASNKAESQIIHLLRAHGPELFQDAIENALEEGEARARKGLAKLPKGSFEITEKQDDGSDWHATITISDDTFLVDLRGNPDQKAAPYNTSRDGAVISCQMIFKALCDPDRYANSGSFVPLEVLTDHGTVFDAGETAAQGYYFETRIRLFDMLWQCMAHALPDRLPMGHFASICGTVIAGQHPDTGRRYTMVEPQMGGWGATADRDGLDAMYSSNHGDTFNCPVEICEARYGIDVLHKRLRERSDSVAVHKGGRGVSIRYRMRDDAILSAGYSRAKVPVWPATEATTQNTNALTVNHPDGSSERRDFVSGYKLRAGDEVWVETANGGDYG
ncbi:hydantoinase B/oxoprolinase family protein [Qingshengfaniella alkalisoli]|uniref:Hydantoinase B/oxoprolinase family protein n=1 Tax=Qingshengfaniella alkalisoli TaxID=2599296 RepID=A0A5B8I8Q7_9RHOB|nr:hydantoinase B/oxoprolinase family protein [Qingshengfaniella alkalisoli]QDY70455.1 hydantoinase B/oxoprolinase family protein [Qingshengfaniella alkalisoli]